MTRTIGYLLLAGGVLAALLGIGLLVALPGLTAGGFALGAVLVIAVFVVPLEVAGIIVLTRARSEEVDDSAARVQRQILDAVKARGQVDINTLVIELQTGSEEIKAQVYRLVGLGVFDGYINWEKGILYSEDAQALHDLDVCRNCGGQIDLVGKGVLTCPYCGTEYFLSKA
ncbi:MAG: hypothetical protein GYB68_13035 [Chloroflexi bacterium]|nr:hypothetical protein [Chloroflexota bacterium]